MSEAVDNVIRLAALALEREVAYREHGSAAPAIAEPSGAYLACVRRLRRIALRIRRSYEGACNREQRAYEHKREREDEARALFVLYRLTGLVMRFNGDPRGAPLQVPASTQNANSWGGDAIVIPYLRAKEYREIAMILAEGEGADECTECGERFDATRRDKRPICPACR